MFAGADQNRAAAICSRQSRGRDFAGEPDCLLQTAALDLSAELFGVALGSFPGPNQQEASIRVVTMVVSVKNAQEVVLPLIGANSAHEEQVEVPGEGAELLGVGLLRQQGAGTKENRQAARVTITGRDEFLPVIF